MPTPEGGSRGLTMGEILMAQSVFGNSISYNRVKIHRKKWASQQNDLAVVTPNGEMYFPPKHPLYDEDYSAPSGNRIDEKRHIFIHEMTHIWQRYVGGTSYVIMSGVPSIFGYGYQYKLDTHNTLADYSLEQQAEIIADYYFVKSNRSFPGNRYGHIRGVQKEYEAVLKDFIKNPSDHRSLIKTAKDPLADYR